MEQKEIRARGPGEQEGRARQKERRKKGDGVDGQREVGRKKGGVER